MLPLSILAVGVIAAVIYLTLIRPPRAIVLTGMVTTDEVIVSPEIQGRLQQVLVREGDVVTNGELLARIQPESEQANLEFYASSQQQATSQ
ncbi:MAG TPA: biotin/lipoyl-binding protein, partial [Candidatus Polarisedimenticolia bacterium]|nr:biotin/lipoyl-binding protein [Candidatus Polarisedimenticolia bacterium]